MEMSPEAVRARSVRYDSPGSGWAVGSSPIRMSPDTELRSSQAGRLSAIPTVKEPEADRRSTEPLVAATEMSPDPEFACNVAPRSDFTMSEPDPDFAVMGPFTSPNDTSPEPVRTRLPLPSIRATEILPELALQVMAEIADEIETRFGVRRLAIVHRAGEVPLGEASVAIVTCSPHRDAAFEAARYAIDETKARAPIWKAERFADGKVWIGEPAREAPKA